jgi:small subunit ribosomal protein S4e
VQAKGVP